MHHRPTLLIASRHAPFAAALRLYIDLLCPRGELNHRIEHIGFTSAAELFALLDDRPPEQLRDMMVFLDVSGEEGGAWKVKDMWLEHGLAAQLLMSYPEIYFVFLYNSNTPDAYPAGLPPEKSQGLYPYHFVNIDSLHEVVGLIRLHARGLRMIFDATGLRSFIKRELLEKVGSEVSRAYAPLLESRWNHAAAAADEESAFMYLNGYAAYQAGFRSWLVSTKSEFCRVIAQSALPGQEEDGDTAGGGSQSPSRVVVPEGFGVVISDWDLVFPDERDDDRKDSLLKTTNRLEAIERLILVTGVSSFDQKQILDRYVGFRVSKPYGGILELIRMKMEHKDLVNPLDTRYREAWAGIISDHSDGFRNKVSQWPGNLVAGLRQACRRVAITLPRAGQQTSTPSAAPPGQAPPDETIASNSLPLGAGDAATEEATIVRPNRHSAPHARSVVAICLLSRARCIGNGGRLSTEDAVQMALLAGEAKEVLGGLSRTFAYEAIALQNEAEVGAEASFLGMSTRVEVKKRLKNLGQEGRVVQRTASGQMSGAQAENEESRDESEKAWLNFMLQAVKNLRLQFSEHEQMEAAEECLRKFAFYQYKLMPGKSGLGGRLHKYSERYIIWATDSGTSVSRLLLFCGLLVLIFGSIYTGLLWSHGKFLMISDEDVAKVIIPVAPAPRVGTLGSSSPTPAQSSPTPGQPSGGVVTTRPESSDRFYDCLALGMWHSFFTFVELQPGISDVEQLKMEQSHDNSRGSRLWMFGYRSILLFELVVAYVHLALLVSVLYRRITKRAP